MHIVRSAQDVDGAKVDPRGHEVWKNRTVNGCTEAAMIN